MFIIRMILFVDCLEASEMINCQKNWDRKTGETDALSQIVLSSVLRLISENPPRFV